MLVFCIEKIIVFMTVIIMRSVYIIRLFWILVDDNSYSIIILYEVSVFWSIIKLLSCNTSIDNVDSRAPAFFCMLVLTHAIVTMEYLHEKYYQFEIRYIWNTDSISNKVPSCDLSSEEGVCRHIQCLIRDFTFPI